MLMCNLSDAFMQDSWHRYGFNATASLFVGSQWPGNTNESHHGLKATSSSTTSVHTVQHSKQQFADSFHSWCTAYLPQLHNAPTTDCALCIAQVAAELPYGVDPAPSGGA